MLHWKNFRDEIIRLVDSVFLQTKTPDDLVARLKSKFGSDSFWEKAATAKVKDGVWKPKKVKGSRLRRKKKGGSRVGTMDRKVSATKVDAKKEPVRSEPQTPTSPRTTQTPTSPGMKDRISQWEKK